VLELSEKAVVAAFFEDVPEDKYPVQLICEAMGFEKTDEFVPLIIH